MDQAQLLDLATQLVQTISPLIAGGALAKIGENTTDAVQERLKRAWELLKARFAHNPKAEATLTLYQDEPGDVGMQRRLAEQIVACFEAHQDAIAELAELVRQLQPAAPPPAGRTQQMSISGNARVGVANVGDVHGGITLGRLDLGDCAPVTPPAQTRGAASVSPTPRPVLPATLSVDGIHFSYGHALLIGVGAYARWGYSAPTTAEDARQFAALLRDPQIAAYPDAQVRVLSDGAATRQGILDTLDAFARQLASAPRPTALLFFAGHGERMGDDYILLPHDYTPQNAAGSAIGAALFHEKVAAIRHHTQKLIVLLNCCHAGGLGDQVLDTSSPDGIGDAPPPGFYEPLISGSGQVVIASSRSAQKSGARSSVDPQLSVFGAQLMAALRGAAPGQDAGIGVFELFAALAQHIPTDAQAISYRGQPLDQHPLFYAHQVDQDFAVALRPGWQGGTLDTSLAETIRQLAESEVALAAYPSEAEAPPELVQGREDLLARLGT